MKRFGFVLAVFGLFLFAQAAQAQWSPIKRLTCNTGDSMLPGIAVDSSGNVHVVWEDGTPGISEIYYKKSTDAGATWSTNKRLTLTPGYSESPAIAVDSSDNLHVVWEDNTPGNNEIYYKQSTAGGATWSTNKRLTWNSGTSANPAIAVDSSDNLHVVWEDDTSGDREIYYKVSITGGAAWSTSKRITWNAANSDSPAIAVDSSAHLHFLWEDDNSGWYKIFYKKSTDYGDTWSIAKGLTPLPGKPFVYRYPAIAVDSSDNLHMACQSDLSDIPLDFEIYYKQSKDAGDTWSANKRLTWNMGDSMCPAIAVDALDNLHMVWYDDTPGIPDIYYRKSTDGGASWSTSQNISSSTGDSMYPAIAADPSGNVHVVWHDDTPGNREIYYRRYVW